MKAASELRDEIEALTNLGNQYPDDQIAQASIAGQIDALKWAMGFAEVATNSHAEGI